MRSVVVNQNLYLETFSSDIRSIIEKDTTLSKKQILNNSNLVLGSYNLNAIGQQTFATSINNIITKHYHYVQL